MVIKHWLGIGYTKRRSQNMEGDACFLLDLQLLCASALSDSEKISRISSLVSTRKILQVNYSTDRLKILSPILSERDDVASVVEHNDHTYIEEPYSPLFISTRPSSFNGLKLENFPNDILLLIARHLDGPSLARLTGVSRKFRTILQHYEQSLWKEQVFQRWKVPEKSSLIEKALNDEVNDNYLAISNNIQRERSMSIASSRFALSNQTKTVEPLSWKRVYEEMFNLYVGQYQFQIITDLEGLDNRVQRQTLLQTKQGKVN
ncbi:hypothetical protein HK096_002525 [Nowakowskiella sp. JEL0078]|nr:hypothetical protein HK096_002525 [Nowakowskiella sp. JEL0078]